MYCMYYVLNILYVLYIFWLFLVFYFFYIFCVFHIFFVVSVLYVFYHQHKLTGFSMWVDSSCTFPRTTTPEEGKDYSVIIITAYANDADIIL